MGQRLEAAKNYLASVAERTIGLDAAKEYYSDNKPSPDNPHFRRAKALAIMGGISAGAIQGFCPSAYRGLNDEYQGIRIDREHPEPYSYSFLGMAGFMVGTVMDMGLALASITNHNPAEAIILKLTANVISNVGGDLAVAAIQRIKTFRPSAATLVNL